MKVFMKITQTKETCESCSRKMRSIVMMIEMKKKVRVFKVCVMFGKAEEHCGDESDKKRCVSL